MICHECARATAEQPAVALCQFCMVGLCKEHLVDLYRSAHAFPQFSCRHQPARPFDADEPEEPGARAPIPRPVSNGRRVHLRVAPAPGI